MDLFKALEFFMERNLRVSLSLGEKKVFEVKASDGNIDLEIKDSEAAKDLIQELRRWTS